MSLTARRYSSRPSFMSSHALLLGALASFVLSVGASRGDDDWLSQAKQEILRQEYRFESQGDRLDAPNRAQDLRTFVTREGVRVEAREAKADVSRGGFTLAWKTSQWGRAGAMEPVEMVGFDAQDGAAALTFGALVERLSNDDRGLKQSFDVPAPPRSDRTLGPLVIEMSLRTDLRARLSESARTITWLTPDGHPRLTLSDLLVRDASGALLTSHFDVAPGALSLVIDDSQAVYPLTVDPLLASASWIEDSNQTGAFFGIAVATAGDVNGDEFSDVIIGAYDFDNGQTNEGRVFLYLGDDTGLPANPSKTFESDQAEAKFGWSISTAGDLNADGFDDFIVGAQLYDGGQADEGRVYVIVGAAATSGIVVNTTLEANQGNARFGYSVSNAGDTNNDGFDDIVIGAPLWDGGQTDEGALFVYRGDGTSVIAAGAPYRFEGNQTTAQFAIAVSGAGDVNADGFDDVIAGSESFDTAGGADFGRVIGLYGSATGVPAAASWTEDGPQAAAGFGTSLGQAGDTNGDGYADIVIGSPQYDSTAQSMGRIYIYRGSSTGLGASASRSIIGDQGGSQFGDTVGTAGDVNGDGYADVFAGANAYDIDGTANRGRMYVYHGSASGIPTTANWTADGTQANAGFGEHSATAGDIDGDGFSDLLVGAGGYHAGQTDEGRVYLYRGSGDGLATNAQATFNINDPSGSGTFGWSVASAGDVNGDGFSDVIIGAPFHRLGGRAWVFLGSLTGVSTTIHAELVPDVDDAQFGYGVSSAGDVNGDGYDDVVVGAPEYYYDVNRDRFAGRVFVYYGSATGLNNVADYTDPDFQPNPILFDDEFGRVTCSAGDVNGDGFGDFYAGDSGNLYLGSATGPDNTSFFAATALSCDGADVNRDGYSDLLIGSGADASIYFGGPTGLDSNEDWTVSGNGFGSSVAFAGDVNGDGHVDVLVGEQFPSTFNVTAHGYYGSATGPDTVEDWTVSGGGSKSIVAGAGDIDGDGISDVVIGFPREFVSGTANAGRASLFFGAANGLSTVSARDIFGSAVGGEMGNSVASAGDVNGDTFGDVIIGEQGRADGFAYVYLGGGGDGLEFIPQNWKRLSDAPLALLGGGDDGTSFRIRARGRIPRGRSNVSMESQVARVDQALSTGAAVKGSFFNTGATDSTGASSAFARTVSGLVAGNAYKWRMRFHSDDPLFPRTRWMSLPGNAAAEADIRMKCPASIWYADSDGDTWGNSGITQSVCLQPAGFVSRSGDCNDTNAAINPGAAEVCDGLDNNCGGGIDEGFLAPTGTPKLTATETGTRTNLSWPALASTDSYDLVRGGLRALATSNGDFKASTTLCLANDLVGTSVSDAAVPGAGDGFYYVARGINCHKNGEYDSLSASQQGDRDAEINASASACP